MRTHVKRDAAAPAGLFAFEAAGLRWLAAAPGGAPVAEPVAVDGDRIETVYLEPAPPSRDAAADLGRRLAATHAAGAPCFGSPPDGWEGPGFIGPLPLAFDRHERWGEFYAALRLEPYARLAGDAGALSPGGVAAVEAVCRRLGDGDLDGGGVPARLHGDLWSGNVVWTGSGAVLVDPSAHGGHPETDLAMLALFGLPHLEAVVGGYQVVTPLADGWRERVPLHQLYPLLVHAALFGGGYGARAEQAARRYA